MKSNNIQYERILQETEHLLNQKIQKNKKLQKDKRQSFLNEFKENLIQNKQKFQKMKTVNEQTRNVNK
jgi:hypothetical protein